METIYSKAVSIDYWDKNAKWYNLWLKHNNYHEEILKILRVFVKPEWRILDIGAGIGVLSIPLAEIGCSVTAIEPSSEMRKIFYKEIKDKKNLFINIDERKWENISISDVNNYNLIIASNSLHLTGIGFGQALFKVFLAKPEYLFLVTEDLSVDLEGFGRRFGYRNIFRRIYTTESSYAYHHIEEVFEHWAFKNGKNPDKCERVNIISDIVYERGHYWRKGKVKVSINLWTRDDIVECIDVERFYLL